jgi:predicted nucleotidyltransferase
MEPGPNAGSRLISRAAAVVDRLAADPRIALVYFFGSALDPERSSVRDLDVAVLSDPPLSLDELVRLRAELVSATALPIDLVSINDAPIVLAHEIVEGGRCLFSRDPDVETDFVTRTRARYWDFAPYRREQWRLAGERLEERLGGSEA